MSSSPERKLALKKERGEVSEKLYGLLLHLYHHWGPLGNNDPYFETVIDAVIAQEKTPYRFEPYHKAIRSPFDYYKLGIDFAKPLVEENVIENPAILDTMEAQLKKGENVILFSNHQTEMDPQLISLALEKGHAKLAEEMIFVAGDRVISDPIAIPFSLGRNLLCIYSKRHIDNPPEKRHEKLLHNQKTMKRMKDLLTEGSKCIYVAPSGGRDRKDSKGAVPVAAFDPNNIEMFRLMAHHAQAKTHFYPFSLATHDILPPPQQIEKELGEKRKVEKRKALYYFAPELDMDHFPGNELSDRMERRQALSDYIWEEVSKNYHLLLKRYV